MKTCLVLSWAGLLILATAVLSFLAGYPWFAAFEFVLSAGLMALALLIEHDIRQARR
jgi:hypothetical protein